MKKFLALLLAAIMCFALAGCGGSGTTSSTKVSSTTSKVLTSSKSSVSSSASTAVSGTENSDAKLDTKMINSAEAAFGSDFKSIQLEDKTLSSGKVSLFVEITADIKDGTADKFISCASNALKLGSLESSKYDSISFTMNYTNAILVVDKKGTGISSSLTCLRLPDSEKKTLNWPIKRIHIFLR